MDKKNRVCFHDTIDKPDMEHSVIDKLSDIDPYS